MSLLWTIPDTEKPDIHAALIYWLIGTDGLSYATDFKKSPAMVLIVQCLFENQSM